MDKKLHFFGSGAMVGPIISMVTQSKMDDKILKAIMTFKLDQHHEKIYDNPNDLLLAGFSAAFILPLIRSYESSEGYKYFFRGEVVDEIIGISHTALVYAIGDYLGVPQGTGSGYTGRGFAMRAVIDEINKLLSEKTDPSSR